MENNRFRSSVMCGAEHFALDSLPIMIGDMVNEMRVEITNTYHLNVIRTMKRCTPHPFSGMLSFTVINWIKAVNKRNTIAHELNT